jgi:hypothetical protein
MWKAGFLFFTFSIIFLTDRKKEKFTWQLQKKIFKEFEFIFKNQAQVTLFHEFDKKEDSEHMLENDTSFISSLKARRLSI